MYLRKLKLAGLKLKLSKCKFAREELELLGFDITAEAYQPEVKLARKFLAQLFRNFCFNSLFELSETNLFTNLLRW